MKFELSSIFIFQILKEFTSLNLKEKQHSEMYNSKFKSKSQFEHWIQLRNRKLKELEHSKVKGKLEIRNLKESRTSIFEGFLKLQVSKKS